MKTIINPTSARLFRLCLALTSLAGGVFIAISTCTLIIHCYLPVPVQDQWAYINKEYFLSIENYFLLHNVHRLATLRLLLFIDTLFGQNNIFLTISLFTSILIFSLIMAMLALNLHRRHRSAAAWALGLSLAFCFSATQWENLHYAFEVCFFLADILCVATFLAMARNRALPVVLLLAALSTYTMANGLLVAALAIPLAILLGWSRREVLILGLAAALLLASYLLIAGGWHADAGGLRFDPLFLAAFIAAELGWPLAAPWPLPLADAILAAQIIGGAGLLMLVPLTVAAWRGQWEKTSLVLLACGWWAVGTAAMTAVGRAAFGMEQALASRYTTFTLMLWLALILLSALHWRRVRGGAMAFGCAAVVLLAVAQPRFAAQALALADGGRASVPALLTRIDDPLYINLDAHPLTILERSEPLVRQHLSVFAEAWADWLGTPLTPHVQAIAPDRCRGHTDAVLALGAGPGHGWRVVGEAWQADGQPVRRLILVDGDGRIAGYGLGGFSKDYSGLPDSGADPAGRRWIGAFRGDHPGGLTAYALVDGAACSLGPPRRVIGEKN